MKILTGVYRHIEPFASSFWRLGLSGRTKYIQALRNVNNHDCYVSQEEDTIRCNFYKVIGIKYHNMVDDRSILKDSKRIRSISEN